MERVLNWGVPVEYLLCVGHNWILWEYKLTSKDDIKWYGLNIQIIKATVLKKLDFLTTPYVFQRVLRESFMGAPEQACCLAPVFSSCYYIPAFTEGYLLDVVFFSDNGNK